MLNHISQTRNLQDNLIAMKKGVLDKCIAKEMMCIAGAKLLHMHPKSFSRLKKLYLKYGEAVLVPKKTGPKHSAPPNKTPAYIEHLVCEVARLNKQATIITIADHYIIPKEKVTLTLQTYKIFCFFQIVFFFNLSLF